MLELMKNVYLFDNEALERDIERLWSRYQEILDSNDSSWEEMNEARAILYFLGYLLAEVIAVGSIERRLVNIDRGINLDNFLASVDSGNFTMWLGHKNKSDLEKLKDFYIVIKKIKNRVNRDSSYLDEDTFNRKYNKLKPREYL